MLNCRSYRLFFNILREEINEMGKVNYSYEKRQQELKKLKKKQEKMLKKQEKKLQKKNDTDTPPEENPEKQEI